MKSDNDLKHSYFYSFSAYGVKIGLSADSVEIISKAKIEIGNNLPFNPTEINFEDSVHRFEIISKTGEFFIKKNGEVIIESKNLDKTLQFLEKRVFILIAEFAESRVFIHAGAVSYKNKGIIFPANSYQGKSTLTSELVKAGAVYYSDDCAVLDENAMLHPFAKKISLRGIEDKYIQTDFPVEHFGGKAGIEPVEVKLIVLTEFVENSKWSPEFLSPGNAIMQILQHTVPIQFNPKFTLEVLHKLINRAIIAKSKRGEAKKLTDSILNILELNS